MTTSQTTTTTWALSGTYFESCNCDTACPCVFLSEPTEDDCTVLVGWHIEKGHAEGLQLDELNVAPNDSVVNNPAFNWTNPANTLPYRGPPLLGIPVNAQQPTVVIEKLPATIIRGCQSSSSAAVFRITAHAVGGDNNAQAIVQTIFYNC